MTLRQIDFELQLLNELDEYAAEMGCSQLTCKLRRHMRNTARNAVKGTGYRIDYDYDHCEWVIAKAVA